MCEQRYKERTASGCLFFSRPLFFRSDILTLFVNIVPLILKAVDLNIRLTEALNPVLTSNGALVEKPSELLYLADTKSAEVNRVLEVRLAFVKLFPQ